MFCQNYTAHTKGLIKKTIGALERDIEQLEINAVNNNLTDVSMLKKRKKLWELFFMKIQKDL